MGSVDNKSHIKQIKEGMVFEASHTGTNRLVSINKIWVDHEGRVKIRLKEYTGRPLSTPYLVQAQSDYSRKYSHVMVAEKIRSLIDCDKWELVER